MTGVDILAAEEVAVEFAFNWTWFWIVFGVAGLVAVIAFIALAIKYGVGLEDLKCASLLLLIGVIGGMLFGVGGQTPTKYETQYKVTVSDEVSMTDFLERYEIIEIEGKIFTVREK